MSALGCDVVATDKPVVWKDDFGWNCDQSTLCRKCNMVNSERLAEEATWAEAMAASDEAREVVPS